MGWKYTKDGRLKVDGQHYKAMKLVLNAQQDGKCVDCGSCVTAERAHLHHLDKRGMGGGKREDWIGNDPVLVDAAEHAKNTFLMLADPRLLNSIHYRAINHLMPALTSAKVTTVTLLCPACHGKRHP